MLMIDDVDSNELSYSNLFKVLMGGTGDELINLDLDILLVFIVVQPSLDSILVCLDVGSSDSMSKVCFPFILLSSSLLSFSSAFFCNSFPSSSSISLCINILMYISTSRMNFLSATLLFSLLFPKILLSISSLYR